MLSRLHFPFALSYATYSLYPRLRLVEKATAGKQKFSIYRHSAGSYPQWITYPTLVTNKPFGMDSGVCACSAKHLFYIIFCSSNSVFPAVDFFFFWAHPSQFLNFLSELADRLASGLIAYLTTKNASRKLTATFRSPERLKVFAGPLKNQSNLA